MNKHTSVIYLFLSICTLSLTNLNAQESKSKINTDPLVQELLALKSKMTESNELNERYKIQLFSGSTLEAANKIRQKFKIKHPDEPASIEYQTPNYKVWVGDFRDRLEAERLFIAIKEDFKSSFVFKPRQ